MKKIFGLVALLLPLGASAMPVTWTLEDVLIGAGTNGLFDPVSVTGSFTYDADVHLYSNVNITSQNGAGLQCVDPTQLPCNNFFLEPFSGSSYNYATTTSTAGRLSMLNSSLFFDGVTGDSLLSLQFTQDLTNAGGTVQFQSFSGEYVCLDETCKFDEQLDLFRSLRYTDTVDTNGNVIPYAGRVVASVPEPSTSILFGVGFALIAFRKRTATRFSRQC